MPPPAHPERLPHPPQLHILKNHSTTDLLLLGRAQQHVGTIHGGSAALVALQHHAAGQHRHLSAHVQHVAAVIARYRDHLAQVGEGQRGVQGQCGGAVWVVGDSGEGGLADIGVVEGTGGDDDAIACGAEEGEAQAGLQLCSLTEDCSSSRVVRGMFG